MRQVVFTVHGVPAPQGSKKGFVNRKTGAVIITDDSKKTKPWREAVKHAVLEAVDSVVPFDGPVEVALTFKMPRPKSHFGTGRNAGIVKESAPPFPATVPDLDKLCRSTLDALTDVGLVVDDSRIVTLRARKRFQFEFTGPGCDVVVREAVE